MTKRRARRLINQLLSSLNTVNVREQFWMDTVQAYVQGIFGDHTRSIALPMFGTYYKDRPYSAWDPTKTDYVVERLEELFRTYLTMIDNEVFYRRNILSDDSNGTLIGILIAVITAVGSIAFLEGQRSANIESNYLVRENKALEYKLNMLTESQKNNGKQNYYYKCKDKPRDSIPVGRIK